MANRTTEKKPKRATSTRKKKTAKAARKAPEKEPSEKKRATKKRAAQDTSESEARARTKSCNRMPYADSVTTSASERTSHGKTDPSGTEDSAVAPSPDGSCGSPSACASDVVPETDGHRLRQASVSVILDRVFGPLAKCDPDLWDRRAYLLLVGSAYERMAGRDDIDTDELVKLARVLAETRRSKAGTPAADSMKTSATERHSENNRLPDHFGEMVRDLYGTSLAPLPAEDKSRTKSGWQTLRLPH